MNEVLDSLILELKSRCNKQANGVCMNHSCLVRGGYQKGSVVDYSIATCLSHEQVKELEMLMNK